MKIIFFGSSKFSVPFLEALHKSNHKIVLVVTNADKETGRGKKILPNPVKLKAIDLNLKYIEIKKMDNDIYQKLLNLNFDGFVVVSFGHIIPKNIIDLSDDNIINVHPSLLPKYRGPSPITTALLNGDKETGVSIMRINENLDSGDIFTQTKFKISLNDNKDILEKKIIEIGTPLLLSVLNLLDDSLIEAFPQKGKATYTKIFSKNDLKIDWNLNSVKILNKIRAFSFEPGAFTFLNNLRIKILNASEYDYKDKNIKKLLLKKDYDAGAIINADKNKGLIVKCGDCEALQIFELKVEGKNKMSSFDFLNGYKPMVGDYFK
ncbi:MAG: methionyl-tRNA formyltransferase [Actinobacteria bacterium]|nr:methionyl-tRNA formyltransferase [Actinomycetota bacterium]